MKELKEMVRLVDNTKKYPEDRQYLICIANTDGDSDIWQIITGRKNAREFIKDNIDLINFDESFILVEGCTLEQRKSIYAFMKHIEKFFEDDPFDIDEYINNADWSESEYRRHNEIDESLSIDNSERIDMSSIMNGTTIINNKEE